MKTSDLDQPQMFTEAQRVAAAPVGGHLILPPPEGGAHLRSGPEECEMPRATI